MRLNLKGETIKETFLSVSLPLSLGYAIYLEIASDTPNAIIFVIMAITFMALLDEL